MADTYFPQEETRPLKSASETADEKSAKVIGSGSSVAALCGLGAIVLAILGLAGLAPVEMCAIAVLAAGAGLLFEGGAIAARHQNIEDAAAVAAGHKGEMEVESGMTAEMVGGVAGIVLGILALINIAPLALLPVSAIVLGATLLLGSGATYQVADIPGQDLQSVRAHRMMHRAASSAAGADVLIGLGSITLGILGLIGVAGHDTPLLSLVALLCVGVAGLLSGSVMGARMRAMFHHH